MSAAMGAAADAEAVAAARDLKARYVSFMDTRRWDEWAALFAPDAVLDAGDDMALHGHPREYGVVRGRDRIVAGSRRALDGTTSLHTVSLQSVDVPEPDRALVTWSMTDRIEHADGRVLAGSGIYHDEYRRHGDRWEIQRIRLERTELAWEPDTR